MKKSREIIESCFYNPDFEQVSFLLFTNPYITYDIANSPTSLSFYYTSWQLFFSSYISKLMVNRLSQTPFCFMIWVTKS